MPLVRRPSSRRSAPAGRRAEADRADGYRTPAFRSGDLAVTACFISPYIHDVSGPQILCGPPWQKGAQNRRNLMSNMILKFRAFFQNISRYVTFGLPVQIWRTCHSARRASEGRLFHECIDCCAAVARLWTVQAKSNGTAHGRESVRGIPGVSRRFGPVRGWRAGLSADRVRTGRPGRGADWKHPVRPVGSAGPGPGKQNATCRGSECVTISGPRWDMGIPGGNAVMQ